MLLSLILIALQDPSPEGGEATSSLPDIKTQLSQISSSLAEASQRLRESLMGFDEGSSENGLVPGERVLQLEEAILASRKVVAEMDALLQRTGEP